MAKYRIAVVVSGNMDTGGVSSVASFILNILRASDAFEPELIMCSTSYNDPHSSRIMHPTTWFKGIDIEETAWQNFNAYYVGANFTEFEFQRYLPRKRLTELLSHFDLIQVVSGIPALAYLARHINSPTCLFLATLARLERKPMIQSAGFLRRVYSKINLPLVSQIEIEALRICNHIFAESEYTRQAILQHVASNQISIDTIGVDTQVFYPLPEEERTDDFILSVGRFSDARKNIALLIEAYALVKNQIPTAPKLVLAGKTLPNQSVWSRVKALGLQHEIVTKENISLSQLVTLYQNASLFALSSDEEGLGIVLLEAMACGTPVVSTRCGGPDSVISNEVGFLTHVGDANAMAEKLIWMLRNPVQRRNMGQAGRRLVENRFSNEVVGKHYLDVYSRLLKD